MRIQHSIKCPELVLGHEPHLIAAGRLLRELDPSARIPRPVPEDLGGGERCGEEAVVAGQGLRPHRRTLHPAGLLLPVLHPQDDVLTGDGSNGQPAQLRAGEVVRDGFLVPAQLVPAKPGSQGVPSPGLVPAS